MKILAVLVMLFSVYKLFTAKTVTMFGVNFTPVNTTEHIVLLVATIILALVVICHKCKEKRDSSEEHQSEKKNTQADTTWFPKPKGSQ